MPTEITLPFIHLTVLSCDSLITWAWLESEIGYQLASGVSICITRTKGAEKQGGYFFHFRKTDKGFVFSTFDRDAVLTLSTGEQCAAFMNHVSGRQYDEKMWKKCQEVNLRSD